MASNPPGACCVVGVKHEGEASGEMKSIGDVETYFAYPESKSTENAILLITDVIGHKFINAQLIADQYAANGYFVVMPDLFAGDPIPLQRPSDFSLPTWLKGHLPDKVDPIIEASLKEMKEQYGCKKIGAVGYCFGAKYVCRFLKKGKIDVGFSAHPSFVEEDEVLGIEGPYSIAAAQTDEIFTVEKRHLSEKLLPKTGQPWQICLYSGVEHGFAVRGDMNKPEVKFAKEQAFEQAVKWFQTFLK